MRISDAQRGSHRGSTLVAVDVEGVRPFHGLEDDGVATHAFESAHRLVHATREQVLGLLEDLQETCTDTSSCIGIYLVEHAQTQTKTTHEKLSVCATIQRILLQQTAHDNRYTRKLQNGCLTAM